jgi:hypothetical protein
MRLRMLLLLRMLQVMVLLLLLEMLCGWVCRTVSTCGQLQIGIGLTR